MFDFQDFFSCGDLSFAMFDYCRVHIISVGSMGILGKCILTAIGGAMYHLARPIPRLCWCNPWVPSINWIWGKWIYIYMRRYMQTLRHLNEFYIPTYAVTCCNYKALWVCLKIGCTQIRWMVFMVYCIWWGPKWNRVIVKNLLLVDCHFRSCVGWNPMLPKPHSWDQAQVSHKTYPPAGCCCFTSGWFWKPPSLTGILTSNNRKQWLNYSPVFPGMGYDLSECYRTWGSSSKMGDDHHSLSVTCRI